MNNNHLKIGTILYGNSYKYKIEKVLGQGSFGITYMASVNIEGGLGALGSKIYVAIKEFYMHEINGRVENTVTSGSQKGLYDTYKKKFINESNNLSKLKHPNIVKVIEQFEANNTAYYAMEYIDGECLDYLINQKQGLPIDVALIYFKQICSAVSCMHRNKILHLDIKPNNIMICKNGGAILIDFGLSKQYDENGIPESSTTIGGGTPGYAPIEQTNFRGGIFEPTMDIYALGATLFKMLTGVRPRMASEILNEGFSKDKLVRKGVTDKIIDLISLCMQPQKKKRIQSISELEAHLQSDDVEVTIIDDVECVYGPPPHLQDDIFSNTKIDEVGTVYGPPPIIDENNNDKNKKNDNIGLGGWLLLLSIPLAPVYSGIVYFNVAHDILSLIGFMISLVQVIAIIVFNKTSSNVSFIIWILSIIAAFVITTITLFR
ncbi:MAG: serine/threonine protein kinase [Lentimicrobiaceae bacterium]|nr:serine/threonine protein kinase [Lentimicrobiaceae bacterium]